MHGWDLSLSFHVWFTLLLWRFCFFCIFPNLFAICNDTFSKWWVGRRGRVEQCSVAPLRNKGWKPCVAVGKKGYKLRKNINSDLQLKLETARSVQTSADSYRTIRRQIPKDKVPISTVVSQVIIFLKHSQCIWAVLPTFRRHIFRVEVFSSFKDCFNCKAV
jgi:hypothetical protein